MDKAEKVFIKYAAETGAVVGNLLGGPLRGGNRCW